MKIFKFQNGGLPTAQPADQRYAGGQRVTRSSHEFKDSISIKGVKSKAPWYKSPAMIMEHVKHSSVHPKFNDTTYAEVPSFGIVGSYRTRIAGNNYYFGKKYRFQLPIVGGFVNVNYDKSTPEEQAEYNTLQRRFRTAWEAAKPIDTAPKAEDRYANSTAIPNAKYGWYPAQKVVQNTKSGLMGGGMLPASITRYIQSPGDTVYTELPEAQSRMFRPTIRYERSASTKNPKGQEYNILKRRFNTAWNLAK